MDQTIALLLQYKYLIMFPLAIFEGPILTVIGGFLVSLHLLDLSITYAIIVAGDAFGDSILYVIGRYGGGHLLEIIRRLFKVTEEKMNQAKEYFHLHHRKALILSKVLHGIGIAGLLSAGSLKIPYRHFFFTAFSVSLIQSAILLIIGVVFGGAYAKINQYLDIYASATIIIALFVVIFFIIKKYKILSP